jgi:biopolymer transport protein ExbD
VSVEFFCDHCGRELRADERAVGRRVRCPECATFLVIPEPAATSQPGDESLKPIDESIVELEPVEESEQPAEPERVEQRRPRVEPPPVIPPPRQSVPEPAPPPKSQPSSPATAASRPPLLLPHRKHPEDLIDMTAMVDIVFFLLIFFLVTSLQSLEAVMDLPTPQSAEGGGSSAKSVADLENDPNFITVRIEDDDSIWVEDTQVFNDQELSLRLRAARRESERPRSLLVIGDADATHGAAVRVFDAGAGAGVSGISLLVQEKSESSR